MITIDRRFDKNAMGIIKNMPGKTFLKYRSDPFVFTPSVYGIVGLYIGDETYKVTNFVRTTDYFGKSEDVADFRISTADECEIHSYMDDGKLIDSPVESTISRIRVINEHQCLFHNEEKTYEVYVTRGLIIELADGKEISFEKDVWFSEEIAIKKGYNLIEQFTPCSEFTENWEGINEYRAECTRDVLVIE